MEDKRLPRALAVRGFIQARRVEVSKMLDVLRDRRNAGTKRAFQTLPRHLRRRAMSHNLHRLPRQLRRKAQAEDPSAANPKRKHRRRSTRALAANHVARQGKVRWLETHVWHAKRMHMHVYGAFRLARRPCNKALRSAYRQACYGSTLHDASYLCPVRLAGTASDLVSVLDAVVDAEMRATLHHPDFLNGLVEARAVLHPPGAFPRHAIAPATLVYEADDRDCVAAPAPPAVVTRKRYGRTRLLIAQPAQQQLRQHQPQRVLWVWVHHAAYEEVVRMLSAYTASCGGLVSVIPLPGRILRFQLRGPAASTVLRRVVRVADSMQNANAESVQALAAALTLRSAGSVRAGSVFGVRVKLPVAGLSRATAAAVSEQVPVIDAAAAASAAPSDVRVAASDLWRVAAESNPAPTYAKDDLGIVLVQVPAREDGRRAAFAGWDVLLPHGCGMAFWLGFVYAGARAIGLDDVRDAAREQGVPAFPSDYPDTAAYAAELKQRVAQARSKWQRTPAAARVNYSAINTHDCPVWRAAVTAPSLMPFWRVVDAGAEDAGCVWVVRGVAAHRLAKLLASCAGVTRQALDKSVAEILAADISGAVVRVVVQMQRRGVPRTDAMICVPEASDLHHWCRIGPLQPVAVERAGKAPPMRRIVGYVSSGAFSLAAGAGAGTGAVDVAAFVRAAHVQGTARPLLLVRNATSRNYRFARVSIRWAC